MTEDEVPILLCARADAVNPGSQCHVSGRCVSSYVNASQSPTDIYMTFSIQKLMRGTIIS
jgi:hypothetical protein